MRGREGKGQAEETDWMKRMKMIEERWNNEKRRRGGIML
jgi:hypothetical protein